MTLAAAIKAGAVCMALLSPDVLFCGVGDKTMICQQDGCMTPEDLARSWQGNPERRAAFLNKLYGAK